MTDISSQTLHIVAKELASTLNDARASLEAYAERSDQRALLEKCADELHSAHGVLRLVEVYGAALPSFSATYTGLVNGDTPASLTTAPVPEMFYPVLQRPENFTKRA